MGDWRPMQRTVRLIYENVSKDRDFVLRPPATLLYTNGNRNIVIYNFIHKYAEIIEYDKYYFTLHNINNNGNLTELIYKEVQLQSLN